MKCNVIPVPKNTQLSYHIKYVNVENEKVYAEGSYPQVYCNSANCIYERRYLSVKEKIKSNLEPHIFNSPNFWDLNKNSDLYKSISSAYKRKKGKHTRLRILKSESDLDYNGNFNKEGIINGTRKKMVPIPLPNLTPPEGNMTALVDALLLDIYGPINDKKYSDNDSVITTPARKFYNNPRIREFRLLLKSVTELEIVLGILKAHINHVGSLLICQLRNRDRLTAKREKYYDLVTAYMQALARKRGEDTKMRFTLIPQPGESGFIQWLNAMKMVTKLQGGIPPEFRKRLWLTLAERHLAERGVDWKQAEKICFNEWSNPDDDELGIQIVKDLHRTGCSLFCGAAGRDNQAVLRRVLLGFARWNKTVGYCQGLNVLAALILQVVDRAESSAVKVMIYLVEGVLPEAYFADNLRGLSIDMAVFRDLLRMRLPKLSKHLEALQTDSKDKSSGSSYEPPLTNVFTMQWFLTLFCHCLPQDAVLRIWDLIFLEGDEVLLKTALAIWEGLSDRIMPVTSADEFYSIMGVLTREMLEFTDTNYLIKKIVNMGSLYGVTSLREKHRYNITPWARRLSDDDETDSEEDRLAVEAATAMMTVSKNFKKDRSSSPVGNFLPMNNDRERLALDISSLKQQYARLRERQRQAHIILSAACARQTMVPSRTSPAMNHLLIGKTALVSGKSKQIGPGHRITNAPKPKATPVVTSKSQIRDEKQNITLHWKDAKKPKENAKTDDVKNRRALTFDQSPEGMSTESNKTDSDSDSTSTELCDEPDKLSDLDPSSTSECGTNFSSPSNSPVPSQRLDETAKEPKHSEFRDGFIVDITDKIGKLSSENNIEDSSSAVDDKDASVKVEQIPKDDVYCCNGKSENLATSDESERMPEEFKKITDEKLSSYSYDYQNTYFEDKSVEKIETMKEIPETSKSLLTFKSYDSGENVIGETSGRSYGDLSADDATVNVSFEHSNVKQKSTDTETDLKPVLQFDSETKRSEISETSYSDYLDKDFLNRYAETKAKLEEDFLNRYTEEDEFRYTYKLKDSKNTETTFSNIPISDFSQFNSSKEYVTNDTLSNENTLNFSTDKIKEFKDDSTRQFNKSGESIELERNGKRIYSDLSLREDYKTFKNKEEMPDVTGEDKIELSGLNLTNRDHKLDFFVDKQTTDIINDRKITMDYTRNNTSKYDSDIFESKTVDSLRSNANWNFKDDDVFTTELERKSTYNYQNTNADEHHPLESKSLGREFSNSSSSSSSSSVSLKNDSNVFNYHNTELRSYTVKDQRPASAKSFSSGETLGPDSKTVSNFSPRTSIASDTKDFQTDKVGESPSSTESKTLTTRSIESDDGKFKNSKVEHVISISREMSSPWTTMSTDSLQQKADLSPKLVVSGSSSESYSPGKLKSSERSFSSDLQSPVSANSINYAFNYKGKNHSSESPSIEAIEITSPFYPIHPNQKTPSPYGSTSKPKTTEENTLETSPQNNIKIFDKNLKATLDSEYTNGNKYSHNVDDYSWYKYKLNTQKEMEIDNTYGNVVIEKSKNTPSFNINKYVDNVIKDSFSEDDTLSPLPQEIKLDFLHRGKDEKKLFGGGASEGTRIFERSCSSLDKTMADLKSSPSNDEVKMVKKRSSDILEDIRHLEAKSQNGSKSTNILTKNTGYIWEDVQSLEARRQLTFNDSARSFPKETDISKPTINISTEMRKSYVVEPKINIDDDSILKNLTKNKEKEEDDDDDDRESKLGVWTKVKPRKKGENGRRSSDRALKIIQENSAILQRILTCQAKKRLPDLEAISKEITISPINEEISKIFSPILEKMGLNEYEINEELAKINFKDLESGKTTCGSELDAKINDELCKLSIIDDSEEINHLALDDVIADNYLSTREALIDRQINEELTKLLANCDGIDKSKIQVHYSYKSRKWEAAIGASDTDSVEYAENCSNYGHRNQAFSPQSDIDIHNELEKLNHMSSLDNSMSTTTSAMINKEYSSSVRYTMPPLQLTSPTTTYRSPKRQNRQKSPSSYDDLDDLLYNYNTKVSPTITESYHLSPSNKSSYDFHRQRASPLDYNTLLSKENTHREFQVSYDHEDQRSNTLGFQDKSSPYYQTQLASTNYTYDDFDHYYTGNLDLCSSKASVPNINFGECDADLIMQQSENYDSFVKTSLSPKLSPSYKISDSIKRPVSHPEFPASHHLTKYPDVLAQVSSTYRTSSQSLDNIGQKPVVTTSSYVENSPSPKAAYFSPFPVKTRKPKELGLKLGLYSPTSPTMDPTSPPPLTPPPPPPPLRRSS